VSDEQTGRWMVMQGFGWCFSESV